jgi:hypothetical protein
MVIRTKKLRGFEINFKLQNLIIDWLLPVDESLMMS